MCSSDGSRLGPQVYVSQNHPDQLHAGTQCMNCVNWCELVDNSLCEHQKARTVALSLCGGVSCSKRPESDKLWKEITNRRTGMSPI